jgi:hypothetical protein
MIRRSARWLAPVHAALDGLAEGPVPWFFRDDDAGWADSQLWALADVFGAAGVALDVAAIPAALSSGTAERLSRLATGGAVRVYQHGWSHVNHEMTGRRCEFGRGRSAEQQLADLVTGRAHLAGQLDGRVEPVFVPPWNRCADLTLALLTDLGFAGLSRDASGPRCHEAGPGERPPWNPRLGEVGVCIDWVRLWREGGPVLLGGALAAAVTDSERAGCGGALGVMLHHAAHGPDDLQALRHLLAVIHDHPAVRVSPLAALVSQARLRSPHAAVPAASEPARRMA